MPVPYNMQFELAIMSKLNDDALQIVEQILPYFQPAYNVTVELVEALTREREIFLLSWKTLPCRMTMRETLLEKSLTLHFKIYCKNISVWSYLLQPRISSKRQQSVILLEPILQILQEKLLIPSTPRAIKNYDGDAATTLAE